MILVFQRSREEYPTWSEFEKVFKGVFEKAGRDVHTGIKLPAYFVEAGIGEADGTDTHCLAWPLTRAGEMFASVYQSLLPKALESGVTTAVESRAFLEELNRAASGDGFYTSLSPLLVGAWKRKPV